MDQKMDLGQHLKDRHLNTALYSGVFLDQENEVVTFFLWNLSGQMCGTQQYRPNADKKQKNDPREGRYYTSLHGNKHEKPLAVWGLESFTLRSDVLVIVEGVFDACRLHNAGVPAVALLTSSHKHFRNWLFSLNRKIYKVEDDHGSKLGRYEALQLPENRVDLGECNEEEIKNIISRIFGDQ